MYCKNCGRALNMEEKFCPECGTPVESSSAGKTETSQTVDAFSDAKPAAERTEQEIEKKPEKDNVVDGIVWDVHEFPEKQEKQKVKKAGKIDFDWGNTEEDFPEIFEEINDIPETPIPGKLEMNTDDNNVAEAGDSSGKGEVPVFDNVQASEKENISDAIEKETNVQEKTPEIAFVTTDNIDKNASDDVEKTTDKPKTEAGGRMGEMEKFYTFNKKNEDFQKVLDAEMAKIKTGEPSDLGKEMSDGIAGSEFTSGQNLFTDDLDELFAEKGLSTEVPNTILTHELKSNPEFEQKMLQMERQDRDKEILEEQISAQKEANDMVRDNLKEEPEIPKPFETTAFTVTEKKADHKGNNHRSNIDPGLFKFDTLPDLVPITSIAEDDAKKDAAVPVNEEKNTMAEAVQNEPLTEVYEEHQPAAETVEEQQPAAEVTVDQLRVDRMQSQESPVSENANQRKFDFSALEVIFNENDTAEKNEETVLNFEDLDGVGNSSETVVKEEPEVNRQEKTYEIPENLLDTGAELDDEQQKAGADHIKEMHEARATFFGQTDMALGNEPPEFDWGAATVVLDKKSIKEALAEATQEIEENHAQAAVEDNTHSEEIQEQILNSYSPSETAAQNQMQNNLSEENLMYADRYQDVHAQSPDYIQNAEPVPGSEFDEPKKKSKGGKVLKIIIIILAIILVAELVIIAIKYFSDTSPAAKWIDVQAVKLIKWLNSVF